MKLMSEVCKMVGVTRKTLMGYDKIGLLHPTAKTEGGYWLYDDESIWILMFIQFFVEAGYTRKEIKAVLESSEADILDEVKKLIEGLVEKKNRIEGMLRTINMFLGALQKVPIENLKEMEADQEDKAFQLYRNVSFNEQMDRFFSIIGSATKEDRENLKRSIPSWKQIIRIGRLKSEDPNPERLREQVEKLYKLLLENYSFGKDEEVIQGIEDATEAELIVSMFVRIENLSSDMWVTNAIEYQAGTGALEYVIAVLKNYAIEKCGSEKEFQNLLARKKEDINVKL